MVEVTDEVEKRHDVSVDVGPVVPNKPVAVDFALAVARILSRLSHCRVVDHAADVGVVLHALIVVLCPAAHVRVERAAFRDDLGLHVVGGGIGAVVRAVDRGVAVHRVGGTFVIRYTAAGIVVLGATTAVACAAVFVPLPAQAAHP